MFAGISSIEPVINSGAFPVNNVNAIETVNAVDPVNPVQSIKAANIIEGMQEAVNGFPASFVRGSQTELARVIDRTGETEATENVRAESDWELSEEDKALLRDLKAIDLKVKAHERAHQAAGGELIRKGASYSYQIGPDGQRYAMSGEVSIDTSEVPDDPRATLAKAERVIRAALAPVDPSSTDRQVAAKASAMAADARRDIAAESYENNSTDYQYNSLEQAVNFPT